MGERERAVGRNPVLLLASSSRRRCARGRRAEDRIVAEPGRPARREDERPVHPALERLVRPSGQASASTLTKAARHGGGAARASSSRSTRAMAAAKSFASARPSRRIDPRRAVERLDAEPRIVGERDQPRRARGGLGLQQRIVAEGRPRLLRLVEAELAGADRRRRRRGRGVRESPAACRDCGSRRRGGRSGARARRRAGFAAQWTTIL